MKIGIVCYPSLGGSGIVATELGHELALRGHEVHFITYDLPFRLRLENPNIYFHQVEINQYELFKYPDYALTLAVKIANVSKAYDLDILHVHYAIPHATSAYLAKQILGTVKPYIITTLHGTDITLVGLEPSYFEMVKFSIEQSDGVTAVSQSLCEQIRSSFGVKKNIEVIYNFFIPNSNLIGTKPFHKSWANKGEKILLHASNFRTLKKVDDVIRIFIEVRKKMKVKLVLLGSGNGVESIQQMVFNHQLEHDVIFIEKSINIDDYLASADVFLLPSSQESFGLAALESMAYGVPAVASHVGGLPEVIENGKNGFLAPVGDILKMAKHVIHLLSDDELYTHMSREAIKTVKEKFCTCKIIPQYEAYYQSFLENGDL